VNRPLLLRILPDRLRVAAWARFYRHRHANWLPLYRGASLRHAPRASLELVPGDHISDCIAFTGVYEPALTRRVVALARRGGTMIDIGANLGYFSVLWAAGNPANQCVAFEASPRNVAILRRNVSRNGLDAQIEVVPLAAGAAAGKLQFDVGPAGETGWGGFAPAGAANTIEVDVVRVDERVTAASPIALLKVDIEGADTWALMGCERLLKNRLVQEIWYEQNKPRIRALGISLDAAQAYLRSVGYVPVARSDPAGELVEWSAVPAEPGHAAS
jgi:FkbM family methyltransferase